MQLCECCTQFNSCHLEKRSAGDLFRPCDFFERIGEMSQGQYEALKEQIHRLQNQTKAAPRQRTIVDVDIPLEITIDDYPHPNAWLKFLTVDLNDEKQRDQFVATYIAPYFRLNDYGLAEKIQ